MESLYIAIGLLTVGIIGFFLKEKNTNIIRQLEKANAQIERNSAAILLLQNNHNHLLDKFENLYDAVKELTKEIKNLNIQLAQKKNI